MNLETRKCRSGFLAIRLHYSADPHLWPPPRIAAVKAALPGWRWRKEYEIDFAARAGKKVYDAFDPAVHVKAFDVDLESLPRYKVIDHGRRNPTACLWFAEDHKTRTVYFYREYYRPDATIAEHCHAIRRLETDRETRRTLIDPSTHRRLDTGSGTIADEYARHGIATVPADNNLTTGIDAVTAALVATLARHAIDTHTVHPFFEQRIIPKHRLAALAKDRAVVFHPAMTNTIRELEQLAWDDHADDDTRKPLCERITGPDDHCADCVRYALLRPRQRSRPIRAKGLKKL